MKALLKLIIGLAVVACIAGAALMVMPQITGHTPAGTVVSNLTGSEAAGSLADKVASGTDLSDSEIKNAFGVSDATYNKIKNAAADAGVDLNNGEQMQQLAGQATAHAGELQELANQLQSGEISQSEAASQLQDIIDISELG